MIGLTLRTAADFLPVSLSAAKDRLRITHDLEDTDIEEAIREAVEQIEAESGRILAESAWTYSMDVFPRGTEPITFPVGPISEIEEIRYRIDGGDTFEILDSESYYLAGVSEPQRVQVKNGYSWPILLPGHPDSVQIDFIGGYASAGDVPWAARAAVKILLADRWENRGDQKTTGAPDAVTRLVNILRVGGYP